MLGFLYALIAGAAMSVQGVMNTRLGDKIGVLEANAMVQLVGMVLAILVAFAFGKGDVARLGQAPWYSWLGGVLAPVITITVMLAISNLSPTIAISIILIAQLGVAALIDAFGWMAAAQVTFTWPKLAGLVLMVGGVLFMKFG